VTSLELDEDFNPDERELCPDGACTGVIGDDGKCKVCGTTAGPKSERRARSDDDDDDFDATASKSDEGLDADASNSFEDDRKLCPDGECTGLLGADGKCKVCGATA
jgi:hypothetical protein